MSYQYSNGLCHEALRLLSSDDDFEMRLVRAFGEMGVSREGDTSDEIWQEWKDLKRKYQTLSGEIYQRRKNGVVDREMTTELKEIGQSLVALICDWMEFNTAQISKGILKRAS